MTARNPMHYARWLFLIPAICHAVQAWCVWTAGVKLDTTTLHDLYHWFGSVFGHDITAGVLWFASGTGFLSIFLHERSQLWSLVSIIPQQLLVLIVSWTAKQCIFEGHFADGLIYNPKFILADQIYLPVIGFCHFGLVIAVYISSIKTWIQQH